MWDRTQYWLVYLCSGWVTFWLLYPLPGSMIMKSLFISESGWTRVGWENESYSLLSTQRRSLLFSALFYLSSFLLQIQSRRKHKLFFASSKYFYPGGVPEQLQVPADPHHQVSAARGLRYLSLYLEKLHRPGGGGGGALRWEFTQILERNPHIAGWLGSRVLQ